MKIETGQIAPDFELKDAYEKPHRLADYLNHWVILYFYPKDNTSLCTLEACMFRDNFDAFKTLNTVILGISPDNSKSHQLFSEKQSLPFDLLADISGETGRSYGTLLQLGPIKFCKRHSFIIDPRGKIAKIYRSVSPTKHSIQIKEDLKALQANFG